MAASTGRLSTIAVRGARSARGRGALPAPAAHPCPAIAVRRAAPGRTRALAAAAGPSPTVAVRGAIAVRRVRALPAPARGPSAIRIGRAARSGSRRALPAPARHPGAAVRVGRTVRHARVERPLLGRARRGEQPRQGQQRDDGENEADGARERTHGLVIRGDGPRSQHLLGNRAPCLHATSRTTSGRLLFQGCAAARPRARPGLTACGAGDLHEGSWGDSGGAGSPRQTGRSGRADDGRSHSAGPARSRPSSRQTRGRAFCLCRAARGGA